MTVEHRNEESTRQLSELLGALEKQIPREAMLEEALTGLQLNTSADGASLYIKHGEALRFHIIKNNTLNMDMNASAAAIKSLQEISLHSSGNQHSSISAYCAITKKSINVVDIRLETRVDIGPTKAFDTKFNYQTKSILATPILDNKDNVLGVIQLINAQNDEQSFNEIHLKACAEVAAIISNVLIDGHS